VGCLRTILGGRPFDPFLINTRSDLARWFNRDEHADVCKFSSLRANLLGDPKHCGSTTQAKDPSEFPELRTRYSLPMAFCNACGYQRPDARPSALVVGASFVPARRGSSTRKFCQTRGYNLERQAMATEPGRLLQSRVLPPTRIV